VPRTDVKRILTEGLANAFVICMIVFALPVSVEVTDAIFGPRETPFVTSPNQEPIPRHTTRVGP
jgi:hypothetical protein